MKSQAEIIGEYVMWLEENGSNLHQSFAYSIIATAQNWHETKVESLKLQEQEQSNGLV